jgi:type I restriction enzyme R subunit
MLTGFDSKWLNTLYLDKVLEFEHVIQAFSRTNRVLRAEKKFGNVRYYRKPHTMRANIERAVELYSGNRPVELFVPKLGTHLEDANAVFTQISNLFDMCGIQNFERLPETEADCAEFAKLFKSFADKVEAARVQGFEWSVKTYGADYGLDESVTVLFDEVAFLTLGQRYKELFGPTSPLGDDIPFEIDTHLTSIDTGRIDAQYMESRFVKWLKCLDQRDVSEAETQAVLDELHVAFARLPRADQLLAEVIIHDIQGGDLQLEPGLTFMDYLVAYRSRTEESHLDNLVKAFGVDRDMLVELMASVTSSSDPNSHGRLDQLKATLDMDAAKTYFESITGEAWKPRVVRMRATTLLTDFIANGAFDLDEEVVKRYSGSKE